MTDGLPMTANPGGFFFFAFCDHESTLTAELTSQIRRHKRDSNCMHGTYRVTPSRPSRHISITSRSSERAYICQTRKPAPNCRDKSPALTGRCDPGAATDAVSTPRITPFTARHLPAPAIVPSHEQAKATAQLARLIPWTDSTSALRIVWVLSHL